jgi:hypothetical protein
MNNTTKRNLALAAVFMAAILAVGTFATTTTLTQTALAYNKKDNKRDGSGGNGNGNTITIQKCKQAAIQSGWDNDQEQECESLICTHPGENATCVQEAAAVPTPIPTLVKKTCEQCFTSLLTQAQINFVVSSFDESSLAEHCATLQNSGITEDNLRDALSDAGVSEDIQNQLIACLIQAGIVFRIP